MGNVPGSPWKNLGWVGPRGSQRSLVGVWGWEVMACGSFPERQNPLICGGGVARDQGSEQGRKGEWTLDEEAGGSSVTVRVFPSRGWGPPEEVERLPRSHQGPDESGRNVHLPAERPGSCFLAQQPVPWKHLGA